MRASVSLPKMSMTLPATAASSSSRLARAEALPLVLEDIRADPTHLEVEPLGRVGRAGQSILHAEVSRHLDDFLTALVVVSEEDAVLIPKRLALLKELDEGAFLGLDEFGAFCVVRAWHGALLSKASQITVK
jgi:hypothetical protein